MPDSIAEAHPASVVNAEEACPTVSAPADPLALLNPQQRAAVEQGAECGGICGPLVIIAGAGSGKTNTLAYRVAHLIHRGADPQRILLLTFSRRAASAMNRRVGAILERVLGEPGRAVPPSLPWSGTFHSIGARLLRHYADRIGLADTFTIHDRADSEDLLAIVRHELGFSATRNRFPTKGTCLAVYSSVVNSGMSLCDVLKSSFSWCSPWEAELRKLFHAYVQEKQTQNVLDYDDLLLYWAHMLAAPDLALEIGDRFDHILVDEYQDTNRLQAAILLALKPDGRGVTVVGDDAQSIYSFRAATVRNILDFPGHFDPPAQVMTLERNYRSTQPILDAANGVIGLAQERYAKNLWTDRRSGHKPQLVSVRDESDQARCIAARVLDYREAGIVLRSQAVLFRSSSHSATLELELARRNIPFVKYGGLKFLEAAHIKDVLCVLRWIQNPRGRMAGFRVVRLLPGVGPALAARLLDAMSQSPDPLVAMRGFKIGRPIEADWHALLALFTLLRERASNWPAEMDAVIGWYEPHLQRIYDNAQLRNGDLLQLRRIASTYPSRERFLTDVTLDPPEATSDEAGPPGRDDDYLILSTIHSAKGQEWTTVQVLNVVDGCIPSDMSTATSEEIEEERRLLYVAMTRAKEHLHLMIPQRFYPHNQSKTGDRHLYASRSRFIPEALTRLFEACAWPAAADGEPARGDGPSGRATIDVSARIRSMWR